MLGKCNMVRRIEFSRHGDDNGSLVAIEGHKEIPFEIKRVFYIFGVKGDAVRGQHANRKSEFVLINLAGSSKVRFIDCDGNEDTVVLNSPSEGVYLSATVWKEMYDFSEDAVLLVLASEKYDPSEYIRDYNEYKKEFAQHE